ncbi:MAG: hypothetical protein GXY44_15870 [Phycisphaerales bacterium]|nr:hypothetical protein [Phycisphaerales bacterium]
MREQQLLWVQKNRCRRSRMHAVSSLIDGFQKSGRMVRLSRQRLLVDCIENHTGPELQQAVVWMEQRGATLVIRVKNAADCYALGLRWRQRLVRVLQVEAPSMGIRDIRFLPAEQDDNGRV